MREYSASANTRLSRPTPQRLLSHTTTHSLLLLLVGPLVQHLRVVLPSIERPPDGGRLVREEFALETVKRRVDVVFDGLVKEGGEEGDEAEAVWARGMGGRARGSAGGCAGAARGGEREPEGEGRRERGDGPERRREPLPHSDVLHPPLLERHGRVLDDGVNREGRQQHRGRRLEHGALGEPVRAWVVSPRAAHERRREART